MIDKKYNELSHEEKKLVIKWATEFGYDHPEYTNYDTIDCKFFEDVPMEDFVFYIAKEICKGLKEST